LYGKCLHKKKLSEEEKIGRVMVGGVEKTYRRHFTWKDYTPWLAKKNPLLASLMDDDDEGCAMSIEVIDYLN
jgi:hypothetical protein